MEANGDAVEQVHGRPLSLFLIHCTRGDRTSFVVHWVQEMGVVVRRNPRNPHYDTEMQIKILVECWRAGEGLGQKFVKHSMREHTSRRVGSHRRDRVLRFQRKFSHIGDEDRESHGHLQNNVGGTRRRGRKSARGRDAQSGRRQGSGPTLR